MIKRILVFLVLVILLALPQFSSADTGPKPSMQFNFVFETSETLTITNGEQIVCQESDCRDGSALGNMGPQGFSCKTDSCHSLAYGYDGQYHKLVIEFSDGKTRTSNIFFNDAFDASFKVRVTDNSLLVENTTSLFEREIIPAWVIALITTLVIELLLVTFIAYVMMKDLNTNYKKLMLIVFIMNCFSLPTMWFLLYQAYGGLLLLIIAEVVVVVIEMLALYFFLRPNLKIKNAFWISFLLNVMSFLIGGILLSWVLLPPDVASHFI